MLKYLSILGPWDKIILLLVHLIDHLVNIKVLYCTRNFYIELVYL